LLRLFVVLGAPFALEALNGGEIPRCLVLQRAVREALVVTLTPSTIDFSALTTRSKPLLVEALVASPVAETIGTGALRALGRLDES
jgi:hypothetical protein